MTPTPPSASSFRGYSRQFGRSRRQRNTNPYDASHNNSPAGRNSRTGQTQTLDEGDDDDGDEDGDSQDVSDEDEDEAGGEEETADTTEDVDVNVDDGHGDVETDGAHEEVPMELVSEFDPTGLKEIGNLASWTVSTCKPGCGVEALRDENTSLFWQSDGPQPHHLNIHFSRLVSILSIRIYLDFEADESYTPTRITLLAGTGYHDLLPFSSLEFTTPKGWVDVPLDGVGGGRDGNTLRAFLVQVKVVENHQNGKDTHVRGLKIYAKDERAGGNAAVLEDFAGEYPKGARLPTQRDRVAIMEPDWMAEPELR